MATTVAFVRQLPGILSAEGNLSTGTFVVEFDPTQVSAEQIEQTINDLGYKVTGRFGL